ncbi:MAG: FAD-linked oxidase C-terminal domain-containing protein, partial [Flavobacteriaceae bacterium]|nr:FAD-linked oxidase C-terminal domain-containing protein [Flavobacteriaceae bacterium]
AIPNGVQDLKLLIAFARENLISLIPRAAGTSLAGQCVGEGIVVDTSKYFNKIIGINEKEGTVTLQPGVVRDKLNLFLKPFNLFFGPNTSTSNRCMIGGMVGNNSSGTTSIRYGVTRDKVVSMKCILSDGSEVEFKKLDSQALKAKLDSDTLEGDIYRTIVDNLEDKDVQERINSTFPKPEIHRRNTGYAIDELLKSDVFGGDQEGLNLCKLISGSEGTLAFITEITLQLDKLPPPHSIMVAAHFDSISKCLSSVEPLMSHGLYTCEMMDKTILDCTLQNREQLENRKFIQGDPIAILMCEVRGESEDAVVKKADKLIDSLEKLDLSFANVPLKGEEITKANELRAAGLGLLGNLIGDEKSVACIEDTAVALEDLTHYIDEFTQLMVNHNQKAIYYAHAGAGELHLRPVLNLKKSEDVKIFEQLTFEVAKLVKKYKGSMSGEHGDGIVRSSLIEYMIGEENFNILRKIKTVFDPYNIFNPGKIVSPYEMTSNLRYAPNRTEPNIETFMDFSASMGILRETEKCNGSGDCRKLPEFGGTMCPSYRATLDEKDSTRGRANALREFLTNSEKANKFDYEELKEVFDLCLSCKACASECPSSVDVAALKAEFQYQYNRVNGIPRQSLLFAGSNRLYSKFEKFPGVLNSILNNSLSSKLLKKLSGIAPERSLPNISSKSFNSRLKVIENQLSVERPISKVYLFIDEFTQYLDSDIGIDAYRLLRALNYDVRIVNTVESGRAHISKGLLDKAKSFADDNISRLKDLVDINAPLIGLEPSAILTYVDEYPKLAEDKIAAQKIAKHTMLIEEFLLQEMKAGNIKKESFTEEEKNILIHAHCHQKALRSEKCSIEILNFPENYTTKEIPSGCCGMAGGFGYEKEHYDISMKIGEQTLFPAIREAGKDISIAANGTSCRHQIKDGTGVLSRHPVTILWEALAINN